MESDQIALWRGAAEAFDARHAPMGPDQHGTATPCDGMTVGDLVDHVIDVQIRFGRLLGGDAPEGGSWAEAHTAMEEALARPGCLDGEALHPGLGPTAKTRLLAIATNDLLIHTWDLSRGLGVDDSLPPANLQPAIDGVEAFPPDVRTKLFAQPLEVDDGAGLQDRMLAVAGRRS